MRRRTGLWALTTLALLGCQPMDLVTVRVLCSDGGDAGVDERALAEDHTPTDEDAEDASEEVDTDGASADTSPPNADGSADGTDASMADGADRDVNTQPCRAGETRCSDPHTQLRCVAREGGTAWQADRTCAAQDTCEPRWGLCARLDGRCTSTTAGNLACGSDAQVYRCLNRGGEFLLVPQLDCLREGFSTCMDTAVRAGEPPPAALDACYNACGGRACRLPATPGTHASLWCSRWICHPQPTSPADRCRLLEDREDCRGPGAPCDVPGDSRQCASGRCGADRLCL